MFLLKPLGLSFWVATKYDLRQKEAAHDDPIDAKGYAGRTTSVLHRVKAIYLCVPWSFV